MTNEEREDAISRKSAIEAMIKLEQDDIERYGCAIPEGFNSTPAIEALNSLPSVTPKGKTGWSIVHGVVSNKFWCSSCGYIEIMDNSMNNWNYCPICGAAKMEVSE